VSMGRRTEGGESPAAQAGKVLGWRCCFEVQSAAARQAEGRIGLVAGRHGQRAEGRGQGRTEAVGDGCACPLSDGRRWRLKLQHQHQHQHQHQQGAAKYARTTTGVAPYPRLHIGPGTRKIAASG
jgi:hypothetical protein